MTDQPETYDPGHLLDELLRILGVRNDAGLARALEISPATASSIRCGHIPVGPSILVRMHEASGLSVREMRDLMDRQPV